MFIPFEESIADLTKNVASLGFDLVQLIADKKLFVDQVSINRSECGETGEYDLEGLFIRIADAVKRVRARRVVLDTIEALFGELPNPGIVRAEIRRLFNWVKQKGLTTVITAERDQLDKLTRHGIEEFVSDCVILLDHRIREEISTRRQAFAAATSKTLRGHVRLENSTLGPRLEHTGLSVERRRAKLG